MSTSTWTTEQSRRRLPVLLRRGSPGVPLSTWALLACAFLLGCAVASAAFVGIWRSAARQGDHANAARAATARRLALATGDVRLLGSKLQAVEAKLVRARHQFVLSRSALTQTRLELARRAATVAEISRDAPLLVQQTATVTSDLAALRAYLAKTPGSAVDRGFVDTQLAYIAGAATRLQGSAAVLDRAATNP
jgi:hypothetical protein